MLDLAPILPAKRLPSRVCALDRIAGVTLLAALLLLQAFPVAAASRKPPPPAAASADETPAAKAKAEAPRDFVVFQRSLLRRLLPQSAPNPGETLTSIRLEAAWNQREAAQIAVRALADLRDVRVSASALADDKGHSIPASAVDLRMVRFYSLRLSVHANNRYGVVPKTLEPAAPLGIPAATTRPYWITVHVPDGIPGGLYRGTITVSAGDSRRETALEVDVVPHRLDEAAAILGPLSVPVLRNFSGGKGAEAARTLERADLVFRDIREHGMTSIGLWSGEVTRTDKDGRLVLPDLDAALELYRRHGFPRPLLYAPVNLLSTNKLRTSSNYKHYDAGVHTELAAVMAREYTRRAKEAGIPGIVFAPIEEPNLADGIQKSDAPETRQRMATQLLKAMKEAGGRTAMTCTPESARVAEGNLDYWIVAYKKFDPRVFEEIRKARGHAGLYANSTLMGNGTSFSRFFFGYYPWAQRLEAMMAWTYPLIPKRFPQNVDNRGEGPLHVIDGFLGSDGRPIPVIQWELAREGIDDQRYLATISRMADSVRLSQAPGAKETAAEVTAFLASVRSNVSPDVHAYSFEDPTTLEPIASAGWDEARFEATRHRSFELLKKLTALGGEAPPGK